MPLLRLWTGLSRFPGGRWLFSRLIRFVNPYSGRVGALVLELEPGHAVLRLTDRRGVRNHLDSIHAIALANVAEMASGLAVLTALPTGVRGIPTVLRVEYLKKARGTVTAEARIALPGTDGMYDFVSLVRDAAGDVVARATVTWKIGA